MSAPPAISVRGLTKSYRVWQQPADRLRASAWGALDLMLPFLRFRERHQRLSREVHALHDVSFELPAGAALGILGRNGSGKSTLLQLIAGTLQPTHGEISVRGRVAALLELGAGFHPEFTGRENAFLNGAMLGLSRAEVAARLPDIEAFAEIGDYLDQPVKTYSSGMFVRLAFAVAISSEPDVLIIDESLSVGDVFFQQRCFSRLRELSARGCTLLLVSHDTGAIQHLCDRAILLVDGHKLFDGAPEEAVGRYYARFGSEGRSLRPPGPKPVELPQASAPSEAWTSFIHHYNLLGSARTRYGDQRVQVEAAVLVSPLGLNALEAEMNQSVTLYYLLRARDAVRHVSFGVHVHDRMNECVFAAGARNLGVPLRDLAPGEIVIGVLELQLTLMPGYYTLSIGCSAAPEGPVDNPNVGVVDDRHEGLGPLRVTWPPDRLMPFYGKACLPSQARYLDPDVEPSLPAALLRHQP